MRKSRRQLFAGPYLIWIIGFILLPLAMIIYYAFTTSGGTFTFENVAAIADPVHVRSILLSLKLGIICTIVCLLLAYPLAMILNGLKIKQQNFVVFIFILPMWMNFLLRTIAWMSLLEDQGLINNFLRLLGFEGVQLMYNSGAVLLGMVYNFLPFMVLPIFSVIEKMDHRLIEAAQDLGANSAEVFRRVIFPLSLPGVLSGVTMVFIPSVSTFVISRLLGGGKSLLLGDLIEMQFLGSAYNPHLGSAISLVMMVIVLVCMGVMNRFGEGEGEAVVL